VNKGTGRNCTTDCKSLNHQDLTSVGRNHRIEAAFGVPLDRTANMEQ
jgi:hypothetical protein